MGACSISKKEIILGGLDCAHCAEVINDKVSKLEEIEYCNLNFINKKLTIEIACDSYILSSVPYFKNKEDAQKALEMLSSDELDALFK